MHRLADIRACPCEIERAGSHSVHARRSGNRATSLYYPLTNGAVMLSGAKHLSLFASGIAPGFDLRFFASLRMDTSASTSKGVEASAYNLPTKQACVCEDSRESQLAPDPTTPVRESPKTSRVYTRNEIARQHAMQAWRVQTAKGIALSCSIIHCARDDGGCGFHRVPAWSNGDGW